MPRYFVLGPIDLDGPIPPGALVGSRMSLDYVNQSHEMSPSCDCKACAAMFALAEAHNLGQNS